MDRFLMILKWHSEEFGDHLGPVPPSRHAWDQKLELRRSAPDNNVFLTDLGVILGSSWVLSESFCEFLFDAKVVSCYKLFLRALPEIFAPRRVWDSKINGKFRCYGFDIFQTTNTLRICYLHVFYGMPFQDQLWT